MGRVSDPPVGSGEPPVGRTVLHARQPTAVGAECRRRLRWLYHPVVLEYYRRTWREFWRGGADEDRVTDLTQDCLEHAFGEPAAAGQPPRLGQFDPDLGRLTHWVLAVAQSVAVDDNRKRRTVRRGGRAVHVPLAAVGDVPAPPGEEPEGVVPPVDHALFDRLWAKRKVDLAWAALAEAKGYEWVARLGELVDPHANLNDRLAAHLNVSRNTAKVRLCRLRDKLEPVLRGLIAEEWKDPTTLDGMVEFALCLSGFQQRPGNRA